MKTMHSFAIRILICLLLFSMILTACGPQADEPAETTTANAETTTGGSGEGSTTTDDTTTAVIDEPLTLEALVPNHNISATLTCGDGMESYRFLGITREEYDAACAAFEKYGYTLYCSRDTDNTLSATYVNGDEYGTLFYRKDWPDLVVGLSESGGMNFPLRDLPYTATYETTITQPGLSKDGGMCEIFRLADGSFLIFDSGNPPEYTIIFEELCRLNGSMNDIRISAWVLTHSHGDHYGGFKSFAQQYANYVDLEYVLYSPLASAVWDIADSYNVSWNTIDYYFNGELQKLISQYYPDTTLCSVHAGQTFTFADVTVEILYTPEFVYMNSVPVDTNNTSVVSRVVNEDGSVILMADCGAEASGWITKTYNSELKSDFMQATHHGMLTNADLKIMRKVKPTTYFFPCSEKKFNEYWGVNCEAKQYAISQTEILLHGYGSVTRTLSYRGTRGEGAQLLNDSITVKSNGVDVWEAGADGIAYTVLDATDPYVSFETKIDTAKYNALRVTVKCPVYKQCTLSWTSGEQEPLAFTSQNQKPLGPQGNTSSGVVTLIVYMGNGVDFTGDVTSLRIDLGTEAGQEITIQSIEAFWVEMEA